MRIQGFLSCAILWLMVAPASVGAQIDVRVFAGRGPVTVHVPPGYLPGRPMPLVLLLHGYASSGEVAEAYMELTPLSDSMGFLYSYPDGLTDLLGLRYWNGTDACCQLYGDSDDSGYLEDLIEVIAGRFTVDPRRVYVTGVSNGGFMSYRMACDHADRIAAAVSVAGATWLDPRDCAPSEPVHVLEIHGTADETIAYGGGCLPGQACYPSAPATAAQWAVFGRCSMAPEVLPGRLDLTETLPGLDTVIARYTRECQPGGSAMLATIVGGPHRPELSESFSDFVVKYLLARPKPSKISCAEVSEFAVSCRPGGALAVRLGLAGARYQGSVDIAVDGELQVLPIAGDVAEAVLRDASDGIRTVELLEPAGCAPAVTVDCE